MHFRKEIGQSLTLKFAQVVAEKRKKGEKIISLGLGEPDFNTPKEIVDSTIEILKSKQSMYSSPLGIIKLREKIVEKLKKENNIVTDINNILVTPGAKQALLIILMALLEPEDEVIVIMPSYVSYIPQILIAEPNARIKYVDIDKTDHNLNIDALKNKITYKTKAIVINTPLNPTGKVFKKNELKQLFDVASQNNIYIISDEVYEKLIFSNVTHFSIGSLESIPQNIITINGFSKSHAMTGWRVGYACFPEHLSKKILKLQQHINTNTCTFIQEALGEVLPIDELYIKEYTAKLKLRSEMYDAFLKKNRRLNGVLPEGSFFAFLNISDLKMDSNTFASELLERTGVATTPGIAFGENWDDHVRISLAVDSKILEEAFNLISNFINNL
jgi:aspartate aminotransferase